jgi:hypothetical protein
MAGPVASIMQVPLGEVLPGDYAPAADDLRVLAHEIESHPSAVHRVGWHWYPEHSEPPPTSSERDYLLLVDMTIQLVDARDDWLELSLDLAWRPQLTVDAAVEVACWCPQDHNMHQVRAAHRRVTGAHDLVDAFAAGTAMLMDVLAAGPFEPSTWRIRAGLPDAPASRYRPVAHEAEDQRLG